MDFKGKTRKAYQFVHYSRPGDALSRYPFCHFLMAECIPEVERFRAAMSELKSASTALLKYLGKQENYVVELENELMGREEPETPGMVMNGVDDVGAILALTQLSNQ